MRAAAHAHRWKLVQDVASAFHHHGICAADGQSWVRSLQGSLSRGAGLSGPIHPNSVGHLVTAALIAPVLAKVLGTDPAAAVAQVRGARDNETTGVAWWWILVAAGAGVLAGLALSRARRGPRGNG